MKNNLKFTLKILLENLAQEQRQKAIAELPDILQISKSTFNRMVYARIGSSQEISLTNTLQLMRYFNIEARELINPQCFSEENLLVAS